MSRLVESIGRAVSAQHILDCSEAEARSLRTKHILSATSALNTVDYRGNIVKVGRKDSESITFDNGLTNVPLEAALLLGKWLLRQIKKGG